MAATEHPGFTCVLALLLHNPSVCPTSLPAVWCEHPTCVPALARPDAWRTGPYGWSRARLAACLCCSYSATFFLPSSLLPCRRSATCLLSLPVRCLACLHACCSPVTSAQPVGEKQQQQQWWPACVCMCKRMRMRSNARGHCRGTGCAWGSAARRRAPLPPPPPPHGCSLRAHRLLLPCTLVLLLQLLHHLVTPAATLPAPHEAAWGCSRLHTPLGLVPHPRGSCALAPPPQPRPSWAGVAASRQHSRRRGLRVRASKPVGCLAFTPARCLPPPAAASNDGAGRQRPAGEGCDEGAGCSGKGRVACWTRRLPARPHADALAATRRTLTPWPPRAGRAAEPHVGSVLERHSRGGGTADAGVEGSGAQRRRTH